MRKEAESLSVDSLSCSAIRSRTWIEAASLDFVLTLEQSESILEVYLLRCCYNGEKILHEEPQKRMPVTDTFMMKTNLNEEHGKNTVLGDMKSNSTIDDNLAPEGALLRIDNNCKNRCNLHGKNKPALSFLKLNQCGCNG